MIIINNKNITDPYINLAVEEFAVRNLNESKEYLFLYINKPSVIIGKNQTVYAELNYNFVKKHRLNVVRRISGGGTVYHDLGNLNFCYIRKFDTSLYNNYRSFTQPIIEALESLGIKASLNERNDIIIDGKKVSGNAQFTSRNKMLSHGTLLFNSNLEYVGKSLSTNFDNLESKATKSIRSKVANISEYLGSTLTINEFKNLVIKFILKNNQDNSKHYFSDTEWNEIHKLADAKYRKWEWNFGRSPKFSVNKSLKLNGKKIESQIIVEHGLIKDINISQKHLYDIFSTRLVGIKYNDDVIRTKVEKLLCEHQYKIITEEELMKLII